MLQNVRTPQNSAAFATYHQLRQAVGHGLARRVELGLRQVRRIGRHKITAQLYICATLANLIRNLAATCNRTAESFG